MKRLLPTNLQFLPGFVLIISILVGTAASQASAQVENLPEQVIGFGSTTTGTINVPGERDTFTFSTEMGDVLLIGASRVSGDLWPEVSLYGPDGGLLAEKRDAVHVEIYMVVPTKRNTFLPVTIKGFTGVASRAPLSAGRYSFQVSTPGTYTILVSDGFNGTYTGSYNLYLQKLNPPSGAAPVAYSQTLTGMINQPAEMDGFTFTAEINDEVIVGMSKVSGDLWQKIRLYDPEGVLLHEAKDAVHAEMTYRIPISGTYTVLAADGFNGRYTGGYNLFLQRLNPPANAGAISFSETVRGNINQPAEMDSYTLQANAGDKLIISTSKVSGNLWPKIRLYDPDGALLHETKDAVHTELVYTAPYTDTFTILFSDGFNGTYTGGYNLFLQRTKDPVNPKAVSYSETYTDSINQPAEMDAFTFRAQANDRVMISMTKVSGDLWQKIRLYDQDGELIAEAKNATQAELSQVLADSGSYTILSSDGFNGTYTGSYTLNLLKLP